MLVFCVDSKYNKICLHDLRMYRPSKSQTMIKCLNILTAIFLDAFCSLP